MGERKHEGSSHGKIALILNSGEYDRLHQAMSITQAAVANDMEVHILVTYDALKKMQEGSLKRNKLTDDDTSLSKDFNEGFSSAKIETPYQMLQRSKDLGKVHVYACSQSMAILHIPPESLPEVIDRPIGYVSFLNLAENANITLYI